MRILLPLAALILAAAITASASACRVVIPPQQRIEMGFANDTIRGAAIAEIVEADYLGYAQAGIRPWRARARLAETLYGEGLPAIVEFERGWGSPACEWDLPALPEPGERWVVYFWKDRAGSYEPWLVMPLMQARAFDPDLTERVR